MSKHLAILSKVGIEAILSGKKTIEARFSQKKIAPYGSVLVGDTVYIKPPGGEIIGEFRVKKVFYYCGLESGDMADLLTRYGKQLSLGNRLEDIKYTQAWAKAKYGTLIFISQSDRFITSPVKIKKSDLRGWMTIE